MKVLSLFDGMSCGQIALEKSSINVKSYVSFEIEKNANLITLKNYPNTIQMGDVFDADFSKYKGFDLLIGGSPCTHWSISSKNRETTIEGIGFKLFKEFLRAKEESSCKFFIYENNYKIHENIKNKITEELGVEPVLINSSLFSAQNRNRLYWTNIPLKELPTDKKIMVKDILGDFNYGKDLYSEVKFIKNDICSDYYEKPLRLGFLGKGRQGERIYSIKGKSVNLTANGGGKGSKTGLYLVNGVVRKLSPVECERLQCVPDNYTEGISDNQRYKLLGNGWTVDVIAHILEGLK